MLANSWCLTFVTLNATQHFPICRAYNTAYNHSMANL